MSEEVVYEQKIEIPSECHLSLDGKTVTVSGPKGTLERTFPEPQTRLRMEESELIATTHINRKRSRALVGTVIAHVRNMLTGVQFGYEYEMKVVYSHFPITVETKGDIVIISAFDVLTDEELAHYRPRLVYVDEKNRIVAEKSPTPKLSALS